MKNLYKFLYKKILSHSQLNWRTYCLEELHIFNTFPTGAALWKMKVVSDFTLSYAVLSSAVQML